MNASKDAMTVANLTQAITLLLRDEIGIVRVTGEISGFTAAASGHRYFTLKDESAQIDCVMWASRTLSFRPKNGMQVVIQGRLTVYAPRGKYQIDCDRMTAAGQGDLYLAFAALKEALAERGYFDPDRKRGIPAFPLKIGVVTSPTGAVIQDILSTLNRRSPHCEIYLCPATVQGENAPEEIASAIKALQNTDANVLIVGRGGGSIEDLWAFNTLPVAGLSIIRVSQLFLRWDMKLILRSLILLPIYALLRQRQRQNWYLNTIAIPYGSRLLLGKIY